MDINSRNIILQDFSSFLFPCESKSSIDYLNSYLKYNKNQFLDFFKDIEIIIVIPIIIEEYLQKNLKLNSELKNFCYILTISNWESWDISIFTGMSRANGDYTYVLDPYQPSDFVNILKEINSYKNSYDIFLFQQKHSPIKFKNKLSSLILYSSFRLFANIPISPLDRKEMIFSRRALNTILRNARKNILLLELAYRSSYPYKKISIKSNYDQKLKNKNSYQRRIKWSMFMRLSDLPTKISSISTLILFVFVILTSTNALLVKLFSTTIFLTKSIAVPGWAYIVIVFSTILLLLNISIYAIQKSLMVIYDEISNKSFDVNSYKRIEN